MDTEKDAATKDAVASTKATGEADAQADSTASFTQTEEGDSDPGRQADAAANLTDTDSESAAGGATDREHFIEQAKNAPKP